MTAALPDRLPVTAMQTYQIAAPIRTHWHPATCAEVDCYEYMHGWTTVLDPVSQADMVDLVRRSGRRPSRIIREPGLISFVFEPGTPCFRAETHRRRLDRPELYLVRGGDWRAHTTPLRRHTRAADWVDEFRTHNDKILTQIGRG